MTTYGLAPIHLFYCHVVVWYTIIKFALSMSETSQAEKESGSSQASQTAKKPGTARPLRKHGRHEPLWGAALFAFMLLFVLASIGGIGWVAYAKWKGDRARENNPSIAALAEQARDEPRPEAKSTENLQPKNEPQPSDGGEKSAETSLDQNVVAAAKKAEITVLNGGSTKGSAGVLADFLKQEGYLKTSAGNTLGNYTGVTIYHTAAFAKEAEAIKASVVKKYPQAKILPADATNKETSAAQVTIIIGA